MEKLYSQKEPEKVRLEPGKATEARRVWGGWEEKSYLGDKKKQDN